ncbi:MAG: rod-binding protein [Roseinatronobacter sp.]
MFTPLSVNQDIRFPPTPQVALRATAQAFEQLILSQALQAAGLHRPPSEINGGAGEDMFASFLADAHARALVAQGGIGLTEHLMRSLSGQGNKA